MYFGLRLILIVYNVLNLLATVLFSISVIHKVRHFLVLCFQLNLQRDGRCCDE